MNEINKLYVINWMGPYSVDEALKVDKTADGCFYIATGCLKNCPDEIGIRYIGITGRDPLVRVCEPDDAEKLNRISNMNLWIGRFTVKRYNSFGKSPDPKRKKAELVESLLVRYFTLLNGKDFIINDKKTRQNPVEPVVIVSQWESKYSDEVKYTKPSLLRDLPEVIMYKDGRFYASDKLREKFK